MNFRKSLRSMHQQSSQSMKKNVTEINPIDLQQCNTYAESAQSTNSSQNSILNKLLLQPPSMKNQQSSNKLSLQSTTKKYQPKFTKPDVQNLIQENINLKNSIQTSNQSINQLKIKNVELQKKIKLLEKGLEKVQKTQNDTFKQNFINTNDKQNYAAKATFTQIKKTFSQQSCQQPFIKTGIIHAQILKKKIADLTTQNISAQNQLKFLKKLPNITIYQENQTQKQHLIAQTIRLKSIIASLSQQPGNEQCQKFQNQFMRLMKEQNQKLKATIRLLQNDKILLKSRQTIQNKLNFDLKKDIQQLKTKLLYKESQLEKINNQNKNLLFKKTTQFRQQQQKKQNQLVSQLKAKLFNSQNERVKLQQNNQFYAQQNTQLKQKQKNLTQQITQIESKYDKLVKKLNEEIQELQFQLNNVKTDYMNLLNSGSIKKKKSLGINKQLSSMSNSTNQLRDNSHNLHPGSQLTGGQKTALITLPSKQYSRPVKWQDLSLSLAHLYIALQQNTFLTIQTLIKSVEESDYVRCGDLISIFIEEPFNISRKEATKLARYICQDLSSAPTNTKVLENQNISVESSLAKTILTSCMQKMANKLSSQYLSSWQKIFTKTKKLPNIIHDQLKDRLHIERQQFCQLVDKCSRQKVQFQQYDFIMVKCMDRELSQEDFVLSVEKIFQIIEIILEASQSNSREK